MSEETTQEVQEEIVNPELAEIIAESKKYRKRAQTAEAENEKIKAKQEEARQEALEAQNKWQELAEERKTQIESLQVRADEWDNYKSTRRDSLLEKLSDDDKELFGELPISKLEKIVERQQAKATITPTTGKPGGAGGYDSPMDAAQAHISGKINAREYAEIRKKFRS